MKRTTLVLFALLTLSSQLFAQWECPSRLASTLKPIGKSNLMWAGELTLSGGVASDYYIANGMAFLGVNYTHKKHTFYAEGGFKSWIRSDSTLFNNSANIYYTQLLGGGMREAFYRYQATKNVFTLGIQSTKGDDHYLINERMVGGNWEYSNNGWNMNVLGGSVVNAFARNGTFCTLGYMYNIIPGRQRAIIGTNLGETNLGMFTLSYKPGERKKKTADIATEPNDSLHQTTDEFGNMEVELPEEKSYWFPVHSVGLVAYDEFGSWETSNTFLTGLYLDFGIFKILNLKPELLYQQAENNKAFIYNLGAEKQINWGSQMTKLFVRYIGVYAIDSLATAQNSYSNVFAGEVIRLDAFELPFVQAGIKHSIPKIKSSIKLQMAMQTEDGKLNALEKSRGKAGKRMAEYDLVLSKNYGKYFLTNLSLGYLQYYYLAHDHITDTDSYKNKNGLFGKIEMRLTF